MNVTAIGSLGEFQSVIGMFDLDVVTPLTTEGDRTS